MQSGDEMLFCESSSRPFASGSAPVQIWRLADFLGVSIFTVSTPQKFQPLICMYKTPRKGSNFSDGGWALSKFVQL